MQKYLSFFLLITALNNICANKLHHVETINEAWCFHEVSNSNVFMFLINGKQVAKENI